MLSMVGYYWFTLFDNFDWNVIKPRGFFYIYFIYNFFNFIRCYMLEFKMFLHIHMIFNFQYTRVSSGVIYNVFPNFICNCREESIKLFRNFTCIIYNFIVFTQNYILIPRVTFYLEKNGLTVFQKLTFLAPPVQRSRK